ncbi:MAG: helix-turn-helix domain-containing protein [Lachnospiraceae bacterium]|nr:helix-turn-helix domain-containing protein [Lachnospiraceae bacterium]
MYKPIDQQRTGQKLKIIFKLAGYDVKYIQEYLNLSCPQPIYRWFKGQNLPTVEKLYALSVLLGVHMEELLVLQGQSMNIGLYKVAQESKEKRLLYYAQCLKRVA